MHSLISAYCILLSHNNILSFPTSNLCRHIYLAPLSSQTALLSGCVIVSCSYLSAGALVLLSLQEVQEHLQQSWVLPVWFHHVTSASHKLPQCPKSHLQRWSPKRISFVQGFYYAFWYISHSTSVKFLGAFDHTANHSPWLENLYKEHFSISNSKESNNPQYLRLSQLLSLRGTIQTFNSVSPSLPIKTAFFSFLFFL